MKTLLSILICIVLGGCLSWGVGKREGAPEESVRLESNIKETEKWTKKNGMPQRQFGLR